MRTTRLAGWTGLLGLCGLAFLGLGVLGGCSSGEHSDGHHGSGDGDDGHEGHGHSKEAPPAKGAAVPARTPAAVELKSKEPSASYPLKTCVVSGDSLTEMGGPVAFDYGGTEIQFCCQGCIKSFKKDPETYMKKVRDAAK